MFMIKQQQETKMSRDIMEAERGKDEDCKSSQRWGEGKDGMH